MIGFNFSWIEGCCVHFIERWTGQICYEFKKYLFRLLVVLEDLQGASGLKICQVTKLLNLFREQPPSENEGNVNIFQEGETISSQTWRKKETFGVECWSCRWSWSWSCCWSKGGSTLSHCSHPETSAALLFSQICLKYIWNWQILYLWPHPGTATALLYGSERIFGGEIFVVFSQIWNWANIIVINYSHKWRHPGIFIICSIVTQMNCFVQLMCYLFWNGKEIMQILNGFQVCGGRIWGPSRIEINVSTAGKWPQFSENAILWSLNARTHTHCVWKF